MESLRVLLTSTYYPPNHIGGDALHVRYLAEELVRRGHEVDVCYALDYARLKKLNVDSTTEQGEGPRVHALVSNLPEATALFAVAFGARSPLLSKVELLCKNLKPDLVHHHNVAGYGPLIFRLPADIRVHTSHDYWLVCPKGDLQGRNRELCTPVLDTWWCALANCRPPRLWRLVTNFASEYVQPISLVAPSQFMSSTLKSCLPGQRVVEIPNFVPAPETVEVVESDDPYFLYVGALEKHKGILNLVNRFLDFSKGTGYRLRIVGRGSLLQQLRQVIASSSSKSKVSLEGWQDGQRLPGLYANALATVIPSQWQDNCPLVALESLSCGSPIIVTDVGGLPEIAASNDCGFVVDRGLAKLEQTLQAVFDEHSETSRRKKALEAYERFYSPRAFMARYERLIKSGNGHDES